LHSFVIPTFGHRIPFNKEAHLRAKKSFIENTSETKKFLLSTLSGARNKMEVIWQGLKIFGRNEKIDHVSRYSLLKIDISHADNRKQKNKNREKGFKASGLCIGFDCNYCGVQEG
jgi:hypothetical protein